MRKHSCLAENIGRVDELIDRSAQRQRVQPRIGESLEARIDESAGTEDPKWAVVEVADLLVDRCRDRQCVVSCCKRSKDVDERCLTRLVVRRGEDVEHSCADLGICGELAEAGAEPFAVGRVATFLQKAQPQGVTNEPTCIDARAELVANLRCPTDERLFLLDTTPLACKQPQPDVIRVPGESFARPGQRS